MIHDDYDVGNDHVRAVQHRPLLRFDGSADDYCFPDEATNANNGQCKQFNPEAPIYYNIVQCGDFLKVTPSSKKYLLKSLKIFVVAGLARVVRPPEGLRPVRRGPRPR